MTYLTCTKHRSYQRKHIDVCRQCPDNDECDAFQAHAAIEPPASLEPTAVPEPTATNIPIHLCLQELKDIRVIVADSYSLQETDPLPRQNKTPLGIELIDYIKSELEGIRKLC